VRADVLAEIIDRRMGGPGKSAVRHSEVSLDGRQP
jgi:hypothetical protein